MRTTFSLTAPLPTALSLRLSHDESLDVYLNGVSVFAASQTWMSGYLQTPVNAAGMAALVEGDNVLTVHCNNTTTAQYADVGLGTYQWQVTP